MKRNALLYWVLAVLVVNFCFALGLTNTAAAKSVVIRYGTDLPPHLAPAVGQHWWAEAVTKQTDGRVKVQMYPASSLSSGQAALKNVLTGVADMYMLSYSVHRKAFPLSTLMGLPGLGFPDDTLEANNAHRAAFFELLKRYPAVAAEYQDFGPVFFFVIYSETYLISKGKIIRVPEDVKGLKVGCNGLRMDLMERLKAAPVTDIPPTAYEKLQTGVTQASFVAISAFHDFQLFEVSDHVLDVPFGGGGHPIVINKKTWSKISPEDQKIMRDLAVEGSNRSHQALADLNSLSWKEMVDKGMQVKATPEERKEWESTFKVMWDEWLEQAENMGVKDAKEIFNFWKNAANQAWQR